MTEMECGKCAANLPAGHKGRCPHCGSYSTEPRFIPPRYPKKERTVGRRHKKLSGDAPPEE